MKTDSFKVLDNVLRTPQELKIKMMLKSEYNPNNPM